MTAASIDASSSPHNTLNKDSATLTNSSPMLSPSSDTRFWSALRIRVDKLLENHKPIDPTTFKESKSGGGNDRAKKMKEDSMLLLKGFDSVSCSLSQLSTNIESAIQGARDLAKPPTLSDIVHSTLENAKNRNEKAEEKEEAAEGNRGLKRLGNLLMIQRKRL